jgi:ligand-binding sensor domain-containing protein
MNRILSLLFLTFFCLKGYSQQYNFVNYSIEEGLVQSQVRAICQDDKGYIWIGTLGGVSKFDGINFQNFSTNDGLLNNQVNSIFKDSKGKIWFGTLGGVSIYDGQIIESLEFNDSTSKNFVLSIAEDNDGNMWFATDGGGLIFYNHSTLKYIQLPNGEKNNYIRSVVCDKNNDMWLATRSGLTIINSKLEIKDTLPNINATQVFIEDSTTIWCSTFGTGIWKMTADSVYNLTIDNGLVSNHIRGLIKRDDGSFWFVSKSGISKYISDNFKNFRVRDGLKNENIKCIIEDEEGNLFLGSDGGGIAKFTNEDFVSYTEDDIIGSNVVMSILEDFNSNIWISTYGDGVGVFTSKGYVLLTTEDGLGNNTVWCSMVSKDKHLWVGTDNGLSVFDGDRFKTYNTEHGLNAKKVYALQDDSNNNIWIGTKEGISVLNKTTDSISNLGIGRNVRDIFIDNDKHIWFCSSDGLFKYNTDTKELKVYTDKDGLPSESVMNIIKNENIYWIGTTNGLAVLKNGEISTIKIPGNYASNNINFLELDKFNNLWVGTNFGLYKLNIYDKITFSETDFIRYSNLDGLKSLECNQNASFIDSENNLWFGTSYGLMKHTLNSENIKTRLPKVRIKDIRLFFEKKNLAGYSKGIDSLTSLPTELVLKFNKNHLTFDFVGIHHTSPDKVKYRFKLEGFDKDWQPITQATFVTYSNIPAGNFSFMLSATTDLKKWTKPVTFSFKITPPFWFTWWFYLLALFGLTLLGWLIVNNRKKAGERKRETQLIVDRSKMLSLEQQALNASMNRHFIFNSLNSIQYYINRQDKISANKYLTNFAKLVRKNLDSSLENEIYIDDEIERIDLYMKLEQMRFQDKFNYTIKLDKNLEPQSIKIPSMLLQPFIENSIWHGILPLNKMGNILVDVQLAADSIVIDIIDDGIGIEKSLELKKGKEQHHVSKGMDLTKGRIDLVSKISNKKCSIEGPNQIYDADRNIIGTKVSIILSLLEENTYS